MNEEAKNKVKECIEAIRPNLQADGGDIEFVDIVDDIVKVKLHGACHGCPHAAMTLQSIVENVITEEVHEVKGIENVEF
ncbi:MAG: NifU family protein [Abditibacteriota bacterium]|nr:NifU family protein [Abditibacteriota bacterium]